MGAVDLVIQVESPLSVARGLQRIGRAGHQVGEPSQGVIFPKYRGDLLEMRRGHAPDARGRHRADASCPRNPLDVLAQQLVAAAAERRGRVTSCTPWSRRAENYAELGRESFEAVLGMLAGQYPGDEFAELRPRVVWDRVAGTVQSRRDARTVAVISRRHHPRSRPVPASSSRTTTSIAARPGTSATGGARRRPAGGRAGRGDGLRGARGRGHPARRVAPGASSPIGHDRVLVIAAPGEPGKIPFWKGDGSGRPIELGRALGEFTREIGDEAADGCARARRRAEKRCASDHDLDELAARNLLDYLDEEREATGALPTDRTIVLQRFRDELGDWRVCLLTPVRGAGPRAVGAGDRGAPARAAGPGRPADLVGRRHRHPAARDRRAACRRLRRRAWAAASRRGVGGLRARRRRREEAVRIGSDEVEELVVGALGGSALFASRFRENAARALLLPRRRAGQRTPLWQMRQRSAQLLAVASRYGSLPDHPRDLPRVPPGRVRPAGAARASWPPSSGARSGS